MELPKDPMMLFSFINTKLRDFYPSLDALCKDMNVKEEDIVNPLKAAGFDRQIARYLPHHRSENASKTHPKSSHDKFKTAS